MDDLPKAPILGHQRVGRLWVPIKRKSHRANGDQLLFPDEARRGVMEVTMENQASIRLPYQGACLRFWRACRTPAIQRIRLEDQKSRYIDWGRMNHEQIRFWGSQAWGVITWEKGRVSK